MPTLAEQLRGPLYAARAIAGTLGLRPHTVAIVVGTWSGTYTGRGSLTNATTAITEAGGHPPKIRKLNDEELALGQLDRGVVQIGPITPAFSGGGTDMATLAGDLAAGQTRHVLITGPEHPNGAMFRITAVDADSALHWMIRAEPVADAQPVP